MSSHVTESVSVCACACVCLDWCRSTIETKYLNQFCFLYSSVFMMDHHAFVFFWRICYSDMQPFLSTNLFCVTSVSWFLLILLSVTYLQLWLPWMNRVHNKSITCPTHCPFCVILFLHFPGIDLHLHYPICVPVCPSLPTHMQQPLFSASNLSFYFAPIFSSPWDRSPTSWKSHQHCIALNNS